MDLERAESMIKALPFVSKTIVDDTLYEKVLSFLTLVLSTHSLEDIIQLNNSCQILEQIKQVQQHKISPFFFFFFLQTRLQNKLLGLPCQ